MKGKKILCIVLSLAAVCSLLLMRDSVAWFDTTTGEPASGTITLGKMAFTFNGALAASFQYADGTEYVVTDQNLIQNGGTLSVTNRSTIKTEVRFYITYDTPDSTNRLYKAVTTGNDPDSLSATIDSHWIQTKENNQDTGYFEYYSVLPDPNGATADERNGTKGFAAVADPSNVSATPAITDIHYFDSLIVNNTDILIHDDYFPNGVPFSGTVHVVFEAKQADYVDWTTVYTWATT